MNDSKIAVRYAKALFQLGKDKNQLETLRKDMDILLNVCSDPDFVVLLESPVVKPSRKKEVFSTLFKDQLSELTQKFLQMVVDNKRETYLPGISRNFIDQYRAFKGVKAAQVTTAVALDDAQKDKIKSEIARLFNTDVELGVKVDEQIIGGFVLRVGDQQVDSSISNKLKKVERELINASL